jgi:predicted flap endonuclease-1-like 5' DNA nuclease
MSDRLVEVEGVGQAHAATLAEHGLTTTDDLLVRGARPADRAALANATGISAALILEWVNHADLFRIRGVAGQFADLLEEAGVDTVVELAQRNPDNLAKALAEVSAAKNLTNRVPSAIEVADWVAQAKSLPRAVFYDDASPSNMPAGMPTPAPEADPATVAPSMSHGHAETQPTAGVEPEAPVAPGPAGGPVQPLARPPEVAAPPPRAFEAHNLAREERPWLARLLDRIRGR